MKLQASLRGGWRRAVGMRVYSATLLCPMHRWDGPSQLVVVLAGGGGQEHGIGEACAWEITQRG